MDEKKISLPEVIIMIMVSGFGDIFGLISGLSLPIPVIGQILIGFSFLTSLFIFGVIQLWLIIKGVKSWWFGGGSLFDIFSGGALPLQTPALILTIYLANNAKISKIAGLAK